MSLHYIIMTYLKEQPHTGYSITKEINQSYYWTVSTQQMYRELKKMAAWGWIESLPPTNPPTKKVFFVITDKGKKALQEWLATDCVQQWSNDPFCARLINWESEPNHVQHTLNVRVEQAQRQFKQAVWDFNKETHHLKKLAIKKRIIEIKALLSWYEDVKHALL